MLQVEEQRVCLDDVDLGHRCIWLLIWEIRRKIVRKRSSAKDALKLLLATEPRLTAADVYPEDLPKAHVEFVQPFEGANDNDVDGHYFDQGKPPQKRAARLSSFRAQPPTRFPRVKLANRKLGSQTFVMNERTAGRRSCCMHNRQLPIPSLFSPSGPVIRTRPFEFTLPLGNLNLRTDDNTWRRA